MALAVLVPAVLLGMALAVAILVSVVTAHKSRRSETDLPPVLIHSINDDRCVGCDACVAVCPTNVLDLISNKSRVVHFEDCIQCEACVWACPTEALVMHLEGTAPPLLRVPEIDENFETRVPGQYLIGEVASKPLVKNAANLGRFVVEHMLSKGLRPGALPFDPFATCVDVAIVGSGPGGLSAALACVQRGLSYVIFEKEQVVASTVARYPKGKLVMAEPYDVDNLSLLPVFDSTKEELIPIWHEVISDLPLNIHLGEAVEEVARGGDGSFALRTTVARYRAQRVVLATGTRGKPRTLGVPGENLRKVSSLLEDPDRHRGESVLVVGGGDSALEAAIALADAGARVLMSYRGPAFSRAAARNRSTIKSYEAQRRITVLFQSRVTRFSERAVAIALLDGSEREFPNDAAFVLIGADPPFRWLEKLGVRFVDRPHDFRLGKTDEKLNHLLADQAYVCPDTAAGALALVGGFPPRGVARPRGRLRRAASELSGLRWLMSATGMRNSPSRPPPIPGQRGRSGPPPIPGQRGRSGPPPIPGQQGRSVPPPLPHSVRRRHSGNGRRDLLAPGERTRILRMLRDVGGRMADEDSYAGELPRIR